MPAIGAAFTDERISMQYWFPRIETLEAVTVPETHLIELPNVELPLEVANNPAQLVETVKALPTAEIATAVETLPTETAHIRGDFKASRLAGGEGRRIRETDPKHIDEQVLQLLESCFMMNEPVQAVAIREYLELDAVAESYDAPISPEVRFIVDEGDIIDWFLDVHEEDFDRSFSEADAQSVLQTLRETIEAEVDQLEEMASAIASELDDTGWSIDFLRDTAGEWYVADMALYGLWWDEREGVWKNISHIPADESFNLAVHTPDWVPAEPTEEMATVDRKAQN